VIGPAGRVALYYAPAEDDPLWRAAARWLGRDPASGEAYRQPDLPEMAEITRDARRYGFHATLAPPMRLREGVGWEDLLAAAETIAAGIPPFPLPPLAVADLQGFLALRECAPSPMLQAFCDACVAGTDALRAPLPSEELERRRAARLRPAEAANLARWGYPYVFATWFFHMTLTRRLTAAERALYQPAAEAHFAATLAWPRHVTDICLFIEPEPGAPFRLAARIPLRG
jgi:putative phosphonate metabolism protein